MTVWTCTRPIDFSRWRPLDGRDKANCNLAHNQGRSLSGGAGAESVGFMMAVSSARFQCSLNASPVFAALPGHAQQCCPLKVVKMVSKGDWGRAKVTLAQRTRTLVVAREGAAVDVNAPPSVLVDTLLSLVDGTDRGTQIGDPATRAVDEIVAKLETLCIPEPLSSPLLFGDWEVAYSSNPTAPGGYYRSMLGRALLKTRDMVQSITAPDGITNKVAFAAFGVLDGQVTLQGKLTALDKKWVEVVFEPPQVELGSLKMQYGGNSNVKLAILYLDEVVRIGRGSRGSLFIFKRRT